MKKYFTILKQFNGNLRLFFMATAVHSFIFFGIYTLLLNLYLLRLGYGSAFIGLVNGLAPLVLAGASLPITVITRRLGSRKVMIMGYATVAVGFFLLPLSPYVAEPIREAWIVSSYAFSWIGGAFFVVNSSPYIMGTTQESEQQHAFAIFSGVMPLFGFIGNLVGGFLPGFFAGLFSVTLDLTALATLACLKSELA